MTIQEITTRKEDQTFDCKSIQIDLMMCLPSLSCGHNGNFSTFLATNVMIFK